MGMDKLWGFVATDNDGIDFMVAGFSNSRDAERFFNTLVRNGFAKGPKRVMEQLPLQPPKQKPKK